MLDKINTRKKSDDFEEYISDVYDKYSLMTIDKDYEELFKAFVALIEYIQQMGQTNNDISITEAIQIMKECGFTVERQILHKSQLHFKLQSEYIVDRV